MLYHEVAFSNSGYDVATAATGAEAIREALACQPHLIRMDHLLPDMMGYDAAMHIKAQPLQAPVKIISFSGYPSMLQKQLSEMPVFDGYIEKTLDVEPLQALIKEVCGRIGRVNHCIAHLRVNALYANLIHNVGYTRFSPLPFIISSVLKKCCILPELQENSPGYFMPC